jgi:hypothetical protein
MDKAFWPGGEAMTVRELIEKMQKFHLDADVVLHVEDESGFVVASKVDNGARNPASTHADDLSSPEIVTGKNATAVVVIS